jgi:hypothetical protein
LPDEIPLVIGDIVHNLRTSLDHAIAYVFRRAGLPDKHVYFPFGDELHELVGSVNGSVKNASADIATAIIDEIKPYKAGTYELWALNKIDRLDKHRLIIPIIGAAQVTMHDIALSNNYSIGVLRAIVGQGGIIRPLGFSGEFQVKGKVYPSFYVHFGEGSFFEDKPVIPTLAQVSKFTLEAIEIIERHLT